MPLSDSTALPHRVARAHAGPGYVLIAIPNATRAAMWRQVAMEAGHPVVVVRDGEEAQALIGARGIPALLVTDLSLPRLDGFAVVRGLRQQPRGEMTPVIVVSAFEPLRAAARELDQSLHFSRILQADVDQSVVRSAIEASVGSAHDEPDRAPTANAPLRPAGQSTEASIMSVIARQVVEAALHFGVETCAGLVTLGADEPLISVYSSNPRLLGDNESNLLGTVASEGEPLIIADTESHPLFAADRATRRSLRGFAGIPLTLSTGRPAGALCLLDSRPLGLGAEDLDAFASYATAIAREIERHVPPVEPEIVATALTSEIQALERLAITDELTGLINRRGGESTIGNEIARARRHRTSLTCVLIDIDRFKTVNDTFGHQVGDQVLRELSALFKRTVRAYDTVVRWGGEEFLLVLPGVSLEDAQRLADRIRCAVEAIEVPGAGRITLSAGAAGLGLDYNFEEMLATADRRLYQAKSSGRNCVI
jgi:diguanylate cyclase (GGDEF)-like protein